MSISIPIHHQIVICVGGNNAVIVWMVSVHGARPLRHQLGLPQLLLANEWSHLNHRILSPELELNILLAWAFDGSLMRA